MTRSLLAAAWVLLWLPGLIATNESRTWVLCFVVGWLYLCLTSAKECFLHERAPYSLSSGVLGL